jgi:hypothetical protein
MQLWDCAVHPHPPPQKKEAVNAQALYYIEKNV